MEKYFRLRVWVDTPTSVVYRHSMAYQTTAEVCALYGFSRQRLFKLATKRGITPAKPPPRNGLPALWSAAQVRKLKPRHTGRPARGGR